MIYPQVQVQVNAEVTDLAARIATAGGAMSAAELSAVNKLVSGWKQLGVWPYLKDICLFVGGYQGCLEKLKIHPSHSGNTNMLFSGTALTSSDWNQGGGLQYNGNIHTLKTRVKASDINITDHHFTYIRLTNGGLPTNGITFGFEGANSGLDTMGYSGQTFYPNLSSSELNFQPWGRFNQITYGIHTKSHIPAGGTAYRDMSFTDFEKWTDTIEDAGGASFLTGTKDIQVLEDTAHTGLIYPIRGYTIGLGMPEGVAIAHQNLLIAFYQELNANQSYSLTYFRDTDRIFALGDSLTKGASDQTFFQPYYEHLPLLAPRIGNYGILGARIGGGNDSLNWSYIVANGAGNLKYGAWTGKGSGNNILLLWVGTNDLLNYRLPVDIKADMDTFLASMHSFGWNKAIVFTTWSNTTYTGAGTGSTWFNANSAALVSLIVADVRYTNGTLANGIVRCDTIPQLQDTTNSTYFADGLHCKDAGYAIVSNYAAVAIAQNITGSDSNTEKLPNAVVSDGFIGIDGVTVTTPEIGPAYILTTGILGGLQTVPLVYKNLGVTAKVPANGSGAAYSRFFTDTGSSDGKLRIRCIANGNYNFRLYCRFTDDNNCIVVDIQRANSYTPNVTLYVVAGAALVATYSYGEIGSVNGATNLFELEFRGLNITTTIDGVSRTSTIASGLGLNGTKHGFHIITAPSDNAGAGPGHDYGEGSYVTDPRVYFDNYSISL
jgi:lysophospholipase L1-like esterase